MGLAALLAKKEQVDKEIQSYLQTIEESELFSSISYALLSSGKRLRPILVKIMAEAVGKGFDVNNSALAIELFHTASLIADDLPCMDDDDFRRGEPSLHKKYKESTALLASFAMLTEGFSLIERNGETYYQNGYGDEAEANKRLKIALGETVRLSGPMGVVLGQYFDVEQKRVETEEDYVRLYYLKTGTLFQGAFTLGYIFGGGDLSKLSLIEKLSSHLGFAFQIRDDFEDLEEEVKSYPKQFGEGHAKRRMEKEIESFYKALDQLDLEKDTFEEIISYLFPQFSRQAFLCVP